MARSHGAAIGRGDAAVAAMTCTRCQGLMVREVLRTRQTRQTSSTRQTGRRPSWLWRCYCCGDRVDRVILLARAEQAAVRVRQRDADECDRREWAAWLARMPVGL